MILVTHLMHLEGQKDIALADLKANIEKALDELKGLRANVSADLMTVDEELNAVRRLQADNSQKLVEWSSMERSRQTLEESLGSAEHDLKSYQEKLPETRFIAEALSPAGIPLMIIDHYLPVIERQAQELLHTMSDGQLNIKLEIAETGTKKGIELLAGTSHLRPIKALSGGEQTRVSLALRVALGQVLQDMSNSRFDCLLIDEPEYLDEAGVTQFIQAVATLKDRYSQIFVMSHLPQIKSAFPHAIYVEKDNNVSFATVQA